MKCAEKTLPATLGACRLRTVRGLMFPVSRLQDHVRFETVSTRVIILRLDDRNPHDSGLSGRSIRTFSCTRNTLAGSCEHALAHTVSISADWLGSLAGSHIGDLDDTSIFRTIVATSSEDPRDAVEDTLPCLEGQSTDLGHGPAGSGEG